VCGDVLTYAKALAELEELRAGLPVLALAATGGSLLRRIERLLGGTTAAVTMDRTVKTTTPTTTNL
jgi:hypothetical protein